MFVVIVTGEAEQVFTTPRAVGPFDDFDAAQRFRNDLLTQWEAEASGAEPSATVARVEEPISGVVIGEI